MKKLKSAATSSFLDPVLSAVFFTVFFLCSQLFWKIVEKYEKFCLVFDSPGRILKQNFNFEKKIELTKLRHKE